MIKSAAIAFTLASCVAAFVLANLRDEAPATQAAQSQRVTFYAAIIHQGPAWKDANARGQKLDLSAHFAYMKELRAKGKIVMGGPFSDGTGGLMVYRAATIEEATELASEDPATRAQIFQPELHAWQVNASDVAR